ncbi:protoporphyrinogen oxidase [Capronia coronata CBS 617.96]|uniref:Protoporphyrinogen oxidase n=1 Tax=Capronia coronata CBS 617.96 TaxID=1182541 RepID=W9YNH9_9EURO|nr:protoporphyrinogen oxidase [Capronia coronata CBS 617.96]EXJ90791.1 protoporphyrinogen oxidase [Capronia coronata CBS 617.96]
MRLGGRNALLSHAVKYSLQPRAVHLQSRTLQTLPQLPDLGLKLRDSPNPNAKNVAILGGGITGLAAAWNLQQRIPDVKITIYEKSPRLGGWVQSEKIPVENGHVLFEWGPRTLRPSMDSPGGIATVELIAQLGLADSLIAISKKSPAALNRYVYYPDHLVLLPGPGRGVLDLLLRLLKLRTEPIFDGVVQGLAVEPYVALRDPTVQDESVGDFLRRRFGKSLTDNLASAFFHGIYAGDLYKLSAHALLPSMWFLEGRDRENEPGILLQMIPFMFQRRSNVRGDSLRFHSLYAQDSIGRANRQGNMRALVSKLEQASVYTFKDGLREITTSLGERLSNNANVSIRTSSPVADVIFDKTESQVSVHSDGKSDSFDYVVSTLGPGMTKQFLTSSASRRKTTLTPDVSQACDHTNASVNVMVVNLYYREPDLLPQSTRGFGYLIPRSVPTEQNPERALGVIFGSETSGLPDTVVWGEGDLQLEGQDTAPGTKLTVMLGGHWWEGWAPSDLPSEEEAIEMSKNLLRRHLGIVQAPEVAKAHMNPNCIPQYPVGYRDDMATIHHALQSEYEGRFKVAGPWWQSGVGMSNSIQKALEVSWAIQHQWDDQTGLEDYAEDETWYIFDKRTGLLVNDPES